MHYSRHRLTASMPYDFTLTYALTSDQWVHPGCSLVSLSKTKWCQLSLIQISITPFTRSGKHPADIEQTSRKRRANIELSRPANYS